MEPVVRHYYRENRCNEYNNGVRVIINNTYYITYYNIRK